MVQADKFGRHAVLAVLQRLGEMPYFMLQAQLKTEHQIDLDDDFDLAKLEAALINLFGSGAELMISEIHEEKRRLMVSRNQSIDRSACASTAQMQSKDASKDS